MRYRTQARWLCVIAATGLLIAHPGVTGSGRDTGAQSAPGPEFRLLTPPIIAWSTPESFEVFVMTSHPAACSLEVRKAGDAGGFSAVAGRRHGLIDANETSHRIVVSGLASGGKYEYRLVARQILKFEPYEVAFGSRLETGVHPVDLPEAGASEVRFTVLNDLHKNTPLIRDLMERVGTAKPSPHFVILNGDILSQIEGEEDIPAVLDLPGSYASEHPLIWVRGNHECRGKFARHLTRYLTMPDGRYYYTFRRGPVQFLVLDNGEDKNDTDPAYSGLVDFDTYRARQQEWFSRVIETPEWKAAPFRILISHIPVGHLPGDEDEDPMFFPEYKRLWAEIMNRAGLDLEITAHYHRFRIEDPSDKRTYPVAVGGGPKAETAVIIGVHAAGEALRLEVFDSKGAKIAEKGWRSKDASPCIR